MVFQTSRNPLVSSLFQATLSRTGSLMFNEKETTADASRNSGHPGRSTRKRLTLGYQFRVSALYLQSLICGHYGEYFSFIGLVACSHRSAQSQRHFFCALHPAEQGSKTRQVRRQLRLNSSKQERSFLLVFWHTEIYRGIYLNNFNMIHDSAVARNRTAFFLFS